jgi:hypothetical protein
MNQTTALQDLLQEVMATVNYIKGADEEFYKGQVDAYQNVVDAIEALMPKDRETHEIMKWEILKYERGQIRAWRISKLRSILWSLKLDAKINKELKANK